MKNLKSILLLSTLILSLISKSQTKEVCPGTKAKDWVIISYRPCAGCCGEFGKIVQMPTIKKIVDLPSGTKLEIVPQEIQDGWEVKKKRKCAGCCGSIEMCELITIEKL